MEKDTVNKLTLRAILLFAEILQPMSKNFTLETLTQALKKRVSPIRDRHTANDEEHIKEDTIELISACALKSLFMFKFAENPDGNFDTSFNELRDHVGLVLRMQELMVEESRATTTKH